MNPYPHSQPGQITTWSTSNYPPIAGSYSDSFAEPVKCTAVCCYCGTRSEFMVPRHQLVGIGARLRCQAVIPIQTSRSVPMFKDVPANPPSNAPFGFKHCEGQLAIIDVNPKTHMDPDLRAEPITGYRAWKYDEHRNVLIGVAHPAVWTPGVNEAFCQILGNLPYCPADHVPALTCTCGFWAMQTEELVERALVSYGAARFGVSPTTLRGPWVPSPYDVWGEVQLWGRYVEQRAGFRAQYARITRLHMMESAEPRWAAALEAVYGVPVTRDGVPESMKRRLEADASREAGRRRRVRQTAAVSISASVVGVTVALASGFYDVGRNDWFFAGFQLGVFAACLFMLVSSVRRWCRWR